MKLGYKILLILIVLVGVFTYVWNKHLSTIDLRYTRIGESYMNVTIGENKLNSIRNVFGGDLAEAIKISTCTNIYKNGQKPSWFSIESIGNEAALQLIDCEHISFRFSTLRPNYLKLYFDENDNVVKILRYRYWTDTW